jgi:hypothetical protein
METMEMITLDEFCKKRSLSDKRVELLGGFFHFMKNEKKITKATTAEFDGYLKDFESMPV